jgi:putative DNA primase/helicase
MTAAVVPAIPPEVRATAGRGWRLLPVEASGKLPLINGWPEAATSGIAQLEAWAHQYPACNWGLATGTSSGLVVIDVDGAEGRASLANLERQGLTLPATLTVTTGRTDGGEHRYYRPQAGVDIRNDQSGKIGPHIDVRGTGGFVVCPPSIHASGKQYRFIDPSAPVADLPSWVIERLTVRPPMPSATAQASPQAVRKGSRTNTLVSLAGTMLRRGMSLVAIEAALLAENAAKCAPPLPDAKVRTIAADIVKRYPAGEPMALPIDEWPEPEPLGEELPPVPPFDAGLLPASLRPMVEDVTDRMQTPLDFAAVVAVATLAGLCGRRASMQPKERDSSWVVWANLWGGIVAGPGMMKSPLVGIVTAPARALEADWRAEYADALREYEATQKRAKLDYAVWQEDYKRAKKKEQPLPTEPELDVSEPSQRRLIAVDATFESLHQLLAANPAGVFVLRDELSGWLASLERQGRESERAFYLECWSGDTGFTIDRIGRGSIHVEHCCVSLFGGIQPARLRAYLADALQDGPSNDGLIQRFQLLVWPDIKPDWKYQDRAPNAGAMQAAENVYRRIAGMSADNPLRLQFAPDAQALFVAWLIDLETRLRADDTNPFMLAHLSKYRKLMPALALLFSLADGSLEAVGLHHAQQAADWCEYLAHHARRVYASRISPERLAAISLARRLTKGWKRDSGTFTIRDVYSNDWSGLGTPDEARAAVQVLEDAGWVRPEKPKSDTGRPSEVYAINPKIGGAHVGN